MIKEIRTWGGIEWVLNKKPDGFLKPVRFRLLKQCFLMVFFDFESKIRLHIGNIKEHIQ